MDAFPAALVGLLLVVGGFFLGAWRPDLWRWLKERWAPPPILTSHRSLVEDPLIGPIVQRVKDAGYEVHWKDILERRRWEADGFEPVTVPGGCFQRGRAITRLVTDRIGPEITEMLVRRPDRSPN